MGVVEYCHKTLLQYSVTPILPPRFVTPDSGKSVNTNWNQKEM